MELELIKNQIHEIRGFASLKLCESKKESNARHGPSKNL
jgi:hypothetical protein